GGRRMAAGPNLTHAVALAMFTCAVSLPLHACGQESPAKQTPAPKPGAPKNTQPAQGPDKPAGNKPAGDKPVNDKPASDDTAPSAPDKTSGKTAAPDNADKANVWGTPQPVLPVMDVELKGKTFKLELATTDEQRFHGLSGRNEIASDGGMMF